ncbi:hypothetical protein AJ80_03489 [Polytolypa hystricis UAMH7299]|uniref:DUF159 domain protein n=1 Tax=Polytolypa hystricis (strain UAMH7299) TaxID=1447883 RepID=A0A2B7YI06_POLH7|nr:hypothetical protein AJ80_03489 [Polytolypa hystricis UAMH7299]
MCGRYALGVRLSYIRHQLQQQGLQVDEAPDDDAVRETYNFAPGTYGAVYRADTPDQGGVGYTDNADSSPAGDGNEVAPPPPHGTQASEQEHGQQQQKYKLQSMKWGLVPFWTKRNPDYRSLMRTINCRDDSLIENTGMWTSMKKKKRCVVVCQGFYEWLKKGPGGKEKIPHFVRRKDGNLMFFAGLWDCVNYEGSDEKLYTYAVITTDSNPYLKFLHDRMPVILDAGSAAMAMWLDPHRTTWSKELQSILKPYEGELECYPVSKDVGKVGNNSPNFIIPVNSKENKKNIANFFASSGKGKLTAKKGAEVAGVGKAAGDETVKHEADEKRDTANVEMTEDNAPMPLPKEENQPSKLKREHSPEDDIKPSKTLKIGPSHSSPERKVSRSPSKAGKFRSATSNVSAAKGGAAKKLGRGNQPITKFFK